MSTDFNEEIEIHHHKNVDSPFFEQIKDGKKISECRINKGSDATYKEDHNIKFYNHKLGEVHVKVIGTNKYKNFKEMLEHEIRNVLPEIKSIEEGLDIYRSLYPNRLEEERLGVIVIHFELI